MKKNYPFPSEKTGLIFFFLLALVLTFLVRNNFYFWDTIQLGSIHSHFFFENGFSNIILPEEMDSGHPPIFGMYIAAVWKLFGKSLIISHFAMLPFLWGIIFLVFKLGKYFFKERLRVLIFMVVILSDPCLLGQAALISPDIPLFLFFLMSCYGVLGNKRKYLFFGIAGLCLISMRGMMVAVAVFVFDNLNYFLAEKNFKNSSQPKFSFQEFIIPLKIFSQKVFPYLGGLLGFSFLIYHFLKTGWIGYHEGSPWAPAFDRVDLTGAIKNIGILGWRILDFGRVFLVLPILFFGMKWLRAKIKFDKKIEQIILLLGTLIVFLSPSAIIYKSLSGHRYLLPIFLVINLLSIYLILNFSRNRKIKTTFLLIAWIGLATGNFWVYPKQIAQGWDSTLAHLPYFQLRKKMIHYLDNNKIPIQDVGSAFPNLLPMEMIDLNGRTEKFKEKDLPNDQYIFYSNVMNDFTDEEISELEQSWQQVIAYQKMNICVILYEKIR